MIRDQAVANLAMGLVSATIQIGSSAAVAATSASAIKSTANIKDASLHAATLQAKSLQGQSASQAVGGLGSIVDAAKEYVSASYDASIKETDAEIEMQRAMKEQLDSLNDSFKEVIQKAINTQDQIQQSTNQTRARILG